MKYDYPKEIQIGGHRYKIALIDGAEVDGVQSERHCGSISQSRGIMEIATRTKLGGYRTIQDINTTVLHEIIHSIYDVFAIEHDEDNIERLAQGLLQVHDQLGIQLIKEV